MKRRTVVILLMAIATRAAAQTPDAGADGGPPSGELGPQPLSPIAPPPPMGSLWPDPAAPPPSPVPSAYPVPPTARTLDGPGDEEAKVDFQNSLRFPDDSPLRYAGRLGFIALFGAAEFDVIQDSTQSFGLASNNFGLARPRTPRGDDSQSMATFCDSRLGLRAGTPEGYRVAGVLVAELGPAFVPGDDPDYFCHGQRVRHLYLGLHTPIVDVLVGRSYALFGWGGRGFFPNTTAFLGVPGEIYSFEPQLRVSHIFRWRPVDFEVAGAISGAPQYRANMGEGTLAARLAVNGWRGAAAQGNGPPAAAPLQVGVSLVRRALEVNEFFVNPSRSLPATGQGIAFDAFVPVLPARGDDLGNSLSLTIELSGGTGLADMYTGLTGGVLFPSLPDPTGRTDPTNPPPVYYPDITIGIVTFDAQGRLHTIDWRTLVVGAEYHLPFARGRRVWLSSLVSELGSDNASSLTPLPGLGGVWDRGWYYDLNVFVAPLPPLQLAASYQVTHQTFGDGVEARNARTQFSLTYFF